MFAQQFRFRLTAPMLLLLLAGCSADVPEAGIRPALVIQASAGTLGLEAFAGEVRARQEPELGFRVGGKIARRLVDAGAVVKAGQPLAELDPSDLNLQSEASKAQLASVRSELGLAKSELQRYKNLADQQLVSQSLYDSKLAAYQAAEARARQAQAQASVSGNQAAYSVLRSPGDGVITRQLAEAGQVVAAGQAVFVLAKNGEREVLISVPEQRATHFFVGRDLAVELWTEPGKRFPGKVRELSPSADSMTRTFAARVSFDSGGVPAELGQSARVYALASGTSGMSLPLSALTQRQGRPAVWVVDGQTAKVHLTPVTIGAYGDDGVPVLSGISPEDWVVAAGAHLLLEGERIAPIDRNNRPVQIGAAGSAAKSVGN
jgi:multidrug efflux system membrane fusion protein